MSKLLKHMLAVGLFFGLSVPASATVIEPDPSSYFSCETTIDIDCLSWHVRRTLNIDGAFSLQSVASEAGKPLGVTRVYMSYFYKHMPGSGLAVSPNLHVHLSFGKRSILNGFSHVKFTADGIEPKPIWRNIKQQKANDAFDVRASDLLQHFARASTIRVEVPEIGYKKDASKYLTVATISVGRLAAEWKALAEADKKLDSMQADFENQCAVR